MLNARPELAGRELHPVRFAILVDRRRARFVITTPWGEFMVVPRHRFALVITALVALTAATINADVMKEERTHFKFEGALGRVAGLFGGKAAREGLVSTVAVKGDRRMTRTDNTAQIVDLTEEKVYELDLRRKTYKVVTFDELRRQAREAEEKARREARTAREDKPAAEADGREPQVEIDFDLKESGQTRSIAGHETREVVMTVAVREKGKTLEQAGGMLLVTSLWLAPGLEHLQSDAEFERRFAQKVYGDALSSVEARQQMAAALAMYPGMQAAMERMSRERVNVSGIPLLTTMTVQAVKSEQQVAEEQRAAADDGGGGTGGGLGGMLARRMARKKESPDAGAQPSNRATILTSTNEVLKISDSVSDGDLALPAGFKEAR